ncbi:MAG: electron transport complex subunit RsxE [Treponema sp.]|nr:electron transport complex subunit RsxE [Treponema sp.]
MNRKLDIFTNGIIRENPLLMLNIGLCSALGITTSIFNGLGMGMGMTFVLVMSELVISIFRKFIPKAIRLPVFIIIIASFTTIVQMVLQAYITSLYNALGVFIPLIVVNCIIMGRVEAFASKNKPQDAVLDAVGMGIGYTLVLLAISLIRELLGGGTLFAGTSLKVELIPEAYRIGVLNSAPGGFMVFGILGALMQAVKQHSAAKKDEERKTQIENSLNEKKRIAMEKEAEEKKRIAEAKKAALEKANAEKSAAAKAATEETK